MPSGDRCEGMYLVEHYRPGAGPVVLQQEGRRLAAAAGSMAGEGKAISVVRPTVVPRDEALLCVVAAASEALVRELYARAEVSLERISTAMVLEDDALL